MKNEHKINAETAGQLVVVLSNSKYSYAEFTTFHQTVLHILEQSDLSHLNAVQTKNTMFFIRIVVNLLDAPTIDAFYQQKPALENFSIQHPISNITSPIKTDLSKLLNWIESIIRRNHITIEEMLDQFFQLKLNTILVNPNHAN